MKIVSLGIVCLVSLYILQAYSYIVDLRDQLSQRQKNNIQEKIRLLNDYLKSKGINKQFTENDIYKLLSNRLNRHIQDQNIDIHIIQTNNNTHPVKNNTTHPPKLNNKYFNINHNKNETSKNYKKIQSISEVFQPKKPLFPVWILNPTYYIIEKVIQFLGYLVQDDGYYELEAPRHYYDYST
ncbi:hypothetical protein MN116_004224 [Schistosoma mekongi]|uniref:Uncharacterized protein n=1 Tax=Schistosoma mekongi TaxID=38744 RepID=A0AAE1ZFC4_SCHME|nr:hypothetical protein MN116_004224 [Schistosoma mekongi]